MDRSFTKIHRQFINDYGSEEGERIFKDWVKKNRLHIDVPYGGRNKADEQVSQHSDGEMTREIEDELVELSECPYGDFQTANPGALAQHINLYHKELGADSSEYTPAPNPADIDIWRYGSSYEEKEDSQIPRTCPKCHHELPSFAKLQLHIAREHPEMIGHDYPDNKPGLLTRQPVPDDSEKLIEEIADIIKLNGGEIPDEIYTLVTELHNSGQFKPGELDAILNQAARVAYAKQFAEEGDDIELSLIPVNDGEIKKRVEQLLKEGYSMDDAYEIVASEIEKKEEREKDPEGWGTYWTCHICGAEIKGDIPFDKHLNDRHNTNIERVRRLEEDDFEKKRTRIDPLPEKRRGTGSDITRKDTKHTHTPIMDTNRPSDENWINMICVDCGTPISVSKKGRGDRVLKEEERLNKENSINKEEAMESKEPDVEAEIIDIINNVEGQLERMESHVAHGDFEKGGKLYQHLVTDLAELSSLLDVAHKGKFGAKRFIVKGKDGEAVVPIGGSIINPVYPQGSPITNYPTQAKDYNPVPPDYLNQKDFKTFEVQVNWFNNALEKVDEIRIALEAYMLERRFNETGSYEEWKKQAFGDKRGYSKGSNKA